MKYLILVFLFPVFALPAFAEQLATDKNTLLVNISTDPETPIPNGKTKLKIDFINPHTNSIQEHIDYKVTVTNNGTAIFGPIPTTHTSLGSVTIPVEFKKGEHKITIDVEGILFRPIPIETVVFTKPIGDASAQPDIQPPTSGCLIATAAFGSELAPQVQMLREIRDNTLFNTSSGSLFMAGFNEFYYSFSPGISDLQRQNPLFKDMVRITITPMLYSLSILNYAGIDSEPEVLGYGIGLILLNAGMYFVIPALIIVKTKKRFWG